MDFAIFIIEMILKQKKPWLMELFWPSSSPPRDVNSCYSLSRYLHYSIYILLQNENQIFWSIFHGYEFD